MFQDQADPGGGRPPLDNQVLATIRHRRSIRAYADRPVPEEVIQALLEAAHWAPSAVNSQPWQFVVVTDPERRRRLGSIARFFFVRYRHVGSAPVVIAVLGRPTGDRWYQIDCSLAAENLILAAESLGLGTCYVAGFSVPAARRILGVPKALDILGLITLGYPGESPAPPPRLELKEVVHREVYDPQTAATLTSRLRKSGLLSLGKRLHGLFRRSGRR
ncbi:MAG TPA: nitroreductase family protein [Bacillota bacterium]|jgi:nitroreductase